MADRESLLLKWGTLKGWSVISDASKAALKKYHAEPVAMGCMQQQDTPAQKQALCELIDAIDGVIENDWTGKRMSKKQAKEYVMNYGKEQSNA